MENSLIIGYEVREDGRMYLDLKSNKGMTDYSELLTVTVAALSMMIRMAGEKGHKTEGEVFESVINHLHNEFVNPDSFKDLEIKR
jgi:hypothetical protein